MAVRLALPDQSVNRGSQGCSPGAVQCRGSKGPESSAATLAEHSAQTS